MGSNRRPTKRRRKRGSSQGSVVSGDEDERPHQPRKSHSGEDDHLPLECIQRILHFLPVHRVFVAMAICKTWKLAAERELTDCRSLVVRLRGGKDDASTYGRDLTNPNPRSLLSGRRFAILRHLTIRSSGNNRHILAAIVTKNSRTLRELDIVIEIPLRTKDGRPVVYPNLKKLRCLHVNDETVRACPALEDLTEVSGEWRVLRSVMPHLRRLTVEGIVDNTENLNNFISRHSQVLEYLSAVYHLHLPDVVFENLTEIRRDQLNPRTVRLLPKIETIFIQDPIAAAILKQLPEGQMRSMTVFSSELDHFLYDAVGDTKAFLATMQRFTNLTKLYLKLVTEWDTSSRVKSLIMKLPHLEDVAFEIMAGEAVFDWDGVVEILAITHPQLKFLSLNQFEPSFITDWTMRSLSQLRHLQLLCISCRCSMISSHGLLLFLKGSSRRVIQGLQIDCSYLSDHELKRVKAEFYRLNRERSGVFVFNEHLHGVNSRVIIGKDWVKREVDQSSPSYEPTPEIGAHFHTTWFD